MRGPDGENARTRIVSARLTEVEMKQLRQRAGRRGMTVSDYLRQR